MVSDMFDEEIKKAKTRKERFVLRQLKTAFEYLACGRDTRDNDIMKTWERATNIASCFITEETRNTDMEFIYRDKNVTPIEYLAKRIIHAEY